MVKMGRKLDQRFEMDENRTKTGYDDAIEVYHSISLEDILAMLSGISWILWNTHLIQPAGLTIGYNSQLPSQSD